MSDLYRIALDGYYDEVRESRRSICDMDNDELREWEERQMNGAPWERYATEPKVVLDSLPVRGVALCSWGGATVHVKGDVGDDAIILCQGGGATVTIDGNVGERVRILATGGGANLTVRGTFGFQSRFHVTSNGWVRLLGRVHPEVMQQGAYECGGAPVYYE